jgi:antitoxin MazE
MATQVQVAKWGNSLGLRLPRDLAARAGLKAGVRVDIDATRDGKIVISHSRRRFTMQELLKEMKPGRQHKLEDDAPRGAELI